MKRIASRYAGNFASSAILLSFHVLAALFLIMVAGWNPVIAVAVLWLTFAVADAILPLLHMLYTGLTRVIKLR